MGLLSKRFFLAFMLRTSRFHIFNDKNKFYLNHILIYGLTSVYKGLSGVNTLLLLSLRCLVKWI